MIGVVFVELVGKALKLPPEHIALTAVKVGVTFGVTVTVALPVFPVPVPPPVTDEIVYVEVDVGLTAMLTGLAPVAE